MLKELKGDRIQLITRQDHQGNSMVIGDIDIIRTLLGNNPDKSINTIFNDERLIQDYAQDNKHIINKVFGDFNEEHTLLVDPDKSKLT
jgi:hypothetical protein